MLCSVGLHEWTKTGLKLQTTVTQHSNGDQLLHHVVDVMLIHESIESPDEAAFTEL